MSIEEIKYGRTGESRRTTTANYSSRAGFFAGRFCRNGETDRCLPRDLPPRPRNFPFVPVRFVIITRTTYVGEVPRPLGEMISF